MNMSYDRNNKYSLPYFFGTVGILYNKQAYPNEDFSSWQHYTNPNIKMTFY